MKYQVDAKAFWEENEKCSAPFTIDKPRIPIYFWLDDHFLIDFMSLPSTVKYYTDYDYRMSINKKCNEKVYKVIGKNFYAEDGMKLEPNRFEVIMGARWKYTEGTTPWLESDVHSIDDVKKLISEKSKVDMKKTAFPDGWQDEKKRYEGRTGEKIKLGGSSSRGPATMATSILGVENTCIFIMDWPDIMKEFFELLSEKLIEYHHALMDDTGNYGCSGYSFADDNCYLFPPKQYEKLCAPFLKKIFNEFAPGSSDQRHQHSDSNMAHLMGILRDVGVNSVNFGPEIDIRDIRKAMPDALINGQIPPFTLRNGSPEDIIAAVRHDIDAAGGDGGLVECPAGSVDAGTPLENLIIYMWAVQTYGRYDKSL